MASIKDVAAASGVSPTTVSFVMNNTGAVGARTREKVLKAAHQLNYHPSAIAKGFLHKRMNTIGVVAFGHNPAPLSTPYFAAIVDAIAAAATERHQNVTLFTGEIWSDARHSLPIFSDGRCDGLLLIGPHGRTDILAALLEQNVPYVLINERSEDSRVSSLDLDDVAAAETITAYLCSQGHRRIGLLRQFANLGFEQRREEGYRRALNAAGAAEEDILVQEADVYDDASFVHSLKPFVQCSPAERPTALLCTDDLMAIKAMRTVRQMGWRVPQDFSIAGFDDVWLSAFLDPALTTMRQPFGLIASRALDILLAQIKSGSPSGEKLLFAPELVTRGSVMSLGGSTESRT